MGLARPKVTAKPNKRAIEVVRSIFNNKLNNFFQNWCTFYTKKIIEKLWFNPDLYLDAFTKVIATFGLVIFFL